MAAKKTVKKTVSKPTPFYPMSEATKKSAKSAVKKEKCMMCGK